MAVTIPVATKGAELVENPDGGVAIETAEGDTMVAAAKPLMWDSSENAGGDPVVAPVATEIGETSTGTPTLTLTADEDLLQDPDTVFPVIVDPSFTIDPSGDTWVQTPEYPASQTSSAELKAGTYNGGASKARSFFRFDNGNAKWAGKFVTSATLKLRNFYSGSCTGSAIRVSRITENWSFSSLTWANQPTTSTPTVDFSPAYGYSSSCNKADASWNVTPIVQAWSTGTANYGVRLAALSETSNNTWRRYRSANYVELSAGPDQVAALEAHAESLYAGLTNEPTSLCK